MGTAATLELAIPYFGPRALLEETVTSVLEQSSGDWRLLVVEDGDQGQEVGEWLSSIGDDRILHVVNPTNLGIAGNFQRCLDLCTAELVAFVGCDDRLLPNYVEQVVDTMEEDPGLAAVFPAVTVIDDRGQPYVPIGDRVKAWLRPTGPGPVQGEHLLTSLAIGNWTYFPATCWRRTVIAEHGFRQDLKIALDLELLAHLVLGGHRFAVGDVPAFEYRRHRLSASTTALDDAGRFMEERLVHRSMAIGARSAGWSHAAWHARLRLTSRLHAAALLPAAARRRPRAVAVVSRHVFGS